MTPHAIYQPDSQSTGRRASQSRTFRAQRAIQAQSRRSMVRPEALITRYITGEGWQSQPIRSYAIDGIHPDAPHHRMFGPLEALHSTNVRSLRARARDLATRAWHFDYAVDRIIARATSELDDTTNGHLEALHAAHNYVTARGYDHRSTASRISAAAARERLAPHLAPLT